MKGIFSFKRFNRNRELIPNCWGSYRESTFANIQLIVEENRFFETDDLMVIEISENVGDKLSMSVVE